MEVVSLAHGLEFGLTALEPAWTVDRYFSGESQDHQEFEIAEQKTEAFVQGHEIGLGLKIQGCD